MTRQYRNTRKRSTRKRSTRKRSTRKPRKKSKRKTRKKSKRKTRKHSTRKPRKSSKRKTRKTHKKRKQKGGNPTFYGDSRGITELDSSHFQGETLNHPQLKGKPGIVMMYADWCPHCSNPETTGMWKKMGSMVDSQLGWVGAFNCADEANGNKELSRKLGVQGYPTLMFVSKEGQFMH